MLAWCEIAISLAIAGGVGVVDNLYTASWQVNRASASLPAGATYSRVPAHSYVMDPIPNTGMHTAPPRKSRRSRSIHSPDARGASFFCAAAFGNVSGVDNVMALLNFHSSLSGTRNILTSARSIHKNLLGARNINSSLSGTRNIHQHPLDHVAHP